MGDGGQVLGSGVVSVSPTVRGHGRGSWWFRAKSKDVQRRETPSAPRPDGAAGRGHRHALRALRCTIRLELVEVVAQDLGARRVAQLGHGLGLDLADALARDAVDLADFV